MNTDSDEDCKQTFANDEHGGSIATLHDDGA